MIILLGGLVICTSLLAVISINRLKNRHEMELERIEAVFDQVIHSEFRPDSVQYEEGQTYKLIFKAMRVAEIAEERKQNMDIQHHRIQELIADISHQMRTPLSSIMMYTELMQMTGLSEKEVKEFLGRIEGSSERLMWLASEFIIMTRFETETMQLQPVEEDLNKTIQQAVLENQEAAKQKELHITIDSQKQSNVLLYDPKWTKEAFSNVIENAIKYSLEKTEITIHIERLLSYTRVEISNTGIGISPEAMRLIFQKYYRGENAKEMPGAGIGLHLAKMILEEQKGYILAKEEQEKTTFSLFLLN